MSTHITSDDSQYIISLLHQVIEKQSEHDQKFESIEDQFDTVNARIDGVEIKAELRHCDLMDALNEKVELLKDKTQNHEHRITHIEHALGLAV